jgi:RNA polymerase sigma-70 factor (ECF subfamily)
MGSASDVRFSSIYDRYYWSIYSYCQRRTAADRVEDAVADTFLTAWRRIDDVPEGREALLWLYKVAYRVVGHQWRGAARRDKLEQRLSNLGHEAMAAPEDFVVMNEESRQILAAASRIKETDMEVMRLIAWESLSHPEVADVLGISRNAVKQRFHRAKKNLAKEYNRAEKRQARSPAAQEGGAW